MCTGTEAGDSSKDVLWRIRGREAMLYSGWERYASMLTTRTKTPKLAFGWSTSWIVMNW